MHILNSSGGLYMDALSVVTAQAGDWFSAPGDPVSITGLVKLALAGGGNVSGDFWCEFTPDPTAADYVRCVLPDGCLHTELATVALSTQKIVLTSALTAAKFGLTLSYPVAGKMRFGWTPTSIASIVAGTNTISMHLAMGRAS